MKNPIHEFLDKEYTWTELILITFVILSVGSMIQIFFGRMVEFYLGVMLVLIGVYGYIRKIIKEKKNNKKKKIRRRWEYETNIKLNK